MSSSITPILAAAVTGACFVAVAVGRIMATRIDDARRLAELVRDTRRLRARHEIVPSPRPTRGRSQ